jgi:superfamily I DNA/RNA helicase
MTLIEEHEKHFDFFSQLNQQQKKAASEENKKIAVIAGAGCGKTKTLISRVLYLIRVKKIDPKKIILLTFSKKAIREIEKRISNSLEGNEETP